MRRSSRTLRSLEATVVIAVGLALPRVGQACAVCMGGRDDEVQAAFLGTTALLTFLPLLMIGGVALWLARRARAAERSASADATPEGRDERSEPEATAHAKWRPGESRSALPSP